MVRLTGKSMNEREIEHVGGIIEKPLPLKNGNDLFNHLYKEMKEEALINKKDIKEIKLRAVIQSQRGAVNFIFKTSLNINAGELIQRFKEKGNTDPDIKELLVLSKAKYLDYLESCGQSVKVMMVKLLDN